jgi:hypothetical protein
MYIGNYVLIVHFALSLSGIIKSFNSVCKPAFYVSDIKLVSQTNKQIVREVKYSKFFTQVDSNKLFVSLVILKYP